MTDIDPKILEVVNQIHDTQAQQEQLRVLAEQDDWRTKDIHQQSVLELDVRLAALRRYLDSLIHRTDEL